MFFLIGQVQHPLKRRGKGPLIGQVPERRGQGEEDTDEEDTDEEEPQEMEDIEEDAPPHIVEKPHVPDPLSKEDVEALERAVASSEEELSTDIVTLLHFCSELDC